jgi:hypothetical protein
MIVAVRIRIKPGLGTGHFDPHYGAVLHEHLKISINGSEADMGHFRAHGIVKLVCRGVITPRTQFLQYPLSLGGHAPFVSRKHHMHLRTITDCNVFHPRMQAPGIRASA